MYESIAAPPVSSPTKAVHYTSMLVRVIVATTSVGGLIYTGSVSILAPTKFISEYSLHPLAFSALT